MPQKYSINVMIVNEDSEKLLSLKKFLESHDVNITSVNSWENAQTLIKKKEFAFIFFNSGLQKEKNLEKAGHIGKIAGDTPVIILSPEGMEKEFACFEHETGFVDCISKPITTAVLRNKMNMYTEFYIQKKLLKKQKQLLRQKDEELGKMRVQLEELTDRLNDLSFPGSLTMLPDRRRFGEFLELEWRRCIRSGGEVSLLMIEVDCFEEYIESYGRQAGDELLRKVAAVLTGSAKRVPDFVVHYSEGSFAVVLPLTSKNDAVFVAERMREQIELQGFEHRKSAGANHVTISLGISGSAPSPDSSPADLIEASTDCLDKAREQGGNRVITSD
jgi:diguanylate cyclase (GGDEF)-like protein